jgi:sortase A
MQLKISLPWSLLFVGILGVMFSSVIIIFLIHLNPSVVTSVPNSPMVPDSSAAKSLEANNTEIRTGSNFSSRLKIPAIGVDAGLESVGLTTEGSVDVPKDPVNAAWFNLGPHPGEIGNAIIDGHFGWKSGAPAVFDNLHKLRKGDKIFVEDGKGTTTTFVVREYRVYGSNDSVSYVFSSSDGKAHLNLITCEGTWDKIQKSYSNRLVVFADKET